MNAVRRRAMLLFAGMAATSVCGLVAGARRDDGEELPVDLAALIPERFGDWRIDSLAAAFVRPPGEIESELYQQLLERTYIDGSGRRIMLSIAYGRDQRSGLELHWPDVCYRFAGYSVYGKHLGSVAIDGSPRPITRLMAELPQRPEAVSYWAVLSGERIPDAASFRLRRLAHSVRRERSDALLVRVSSIDPIASRAYGLQDRFIDEMARAIAPAHRDRIVGVHPRG